MRTKKALLILTLLTVVGMPLAASTPAERPVGGGDNGPASITADIKCRVLEVNAEQSTLVLVDLETETPHKLALDDSVKLRARSKKEFGGRKKLGFADLKVGQEIKVTVYLADGSIRRITVLKNA